MSCDCKEERTVIKVKGDVTPANLWVGVVYTSTYQLSPPVLRAPGPAGGLVPMTTGRLQIRRFSFNFASTAHFKVSVTPKYRESFETAFNAHHTGVADNKLTNVNLDSGSLKISAPGRAEDLTVVITNNSVLPSWITGVEWEGVYETSSRRV